MTEKQLQFELMKKDKQIADLYVVIDTLQTNMRSVSSYLSEDKKNEIEKEDTEFYNLNKIILDLFL